MRVRRGATLILEIAEGSSLKSLSKVLNEGQHNDVGGVACEVSIKRNGVKAELELRNRYLPTEHFLNVIKSDEHITVARFVY